MTLVCGDTMITRNMTEPTIEVPPGWSKGANDFQFQISAEADERNGKLYGRLRQVSFQRYNAMGWAITKCNLSTSYVEPNILCVGKVSSAIAIRPSQVAHESATWSVLDQEFLIAKSFFGDFVNAPAVHHSGISSATEYYIVRPDNPYDPQLMQIFQQSTPAFLHSLYSALKYILSFSSRHFRDNGRRAPNRIQRLDIQLATRTPQAAFKVLRESSSAIKAGWAYF